MKSWLSTLFLVLSTFCLVYAQAPNNYYNGTEGLDGEALRTALNQIIDNHNAVSYNSLWSHFQTTDKKPNGKVWDMYSTKADGSFDYQYTFGEDQCGNYSGEGSCYNREHSFPKSWFGGKVPPMNSDLFHLYPTDGKVNGQRGNYPYGEVGTANWTSTNGSKRGTCSYPGYSGVVFEPIDEYKGDFARSYFYMLTRYRSKISSWDSPMLLGNNFASWAEDMLIEWHQLDPVSEKEIARNNAVYGIQGNRNPYIDHPEWAIAVWKPEWTSVTTVSSDVKVWYSSKQIHWSMPIKPQKMTVYNVLGQQMLVVNRVEGAHYQEVDLLPGIYLAKLEGARSSVIKFVVQSR